MNRRDFIASFAALLATPALAAVAEDGEAFESRWRRRILRDDDTALRVMPANTPVDEKKINKEVDEHRKRQQYRRRRYYSHRRYRRRHRV